MFAWMPAWLFAFAVGVTCALMSLGGVVGLLLGVIWALVTFPRLALAMRRRWLQSIGDDGDDRDGPAAAYWRTGTWQSGSR